MASMIKIRTCSDRKVLDGSHYCVVRDPEGAGCIAMIPTTDGSGYAKAHREITLDQARDALNERFAESGEMDTLSVEDFARFAKMENWTR
jgi:hypothetical protein